MGCLSNNPEGTNQNITLTHLELTKLIREVVTDTLTNLGVEHGDPLEMQKDFQHLRGFRKAKEAIGRKISMSLVGMFVLGTMGSILVGLKDYFSN